MEQIYNYTDKGGVIFLALGFLSIYSISIIIYKFFEIYFLNNLDLNKMFKDPDKYSDLDKLLSSIDNFSKKKKTLSMN